MQQIVHGSETAHADSIILGRWEVPLGMVIIGSTSEWFSVSALFSNGGSSEELRNSQ